MIGDSSLAIGDVIIKNGLLHILAPPLFAEKPAVSKPCDTKQCGQQEQCCEILSESSNQLEGICYDPAVQTCSRARASVLCDKTAPLVCGSLCYSPRVFTCVNNTLCPVEWDICSNQCFDPTMMTCKDGQLSPLEAVKTTRKRAQRVAATEPQAKEKPSTSEQPAQPKPAEPQRPSARPQTAEPGPLFPPGRGPRAQQQPQDSQWSEQMGPQTGWDQWQMGYQPQQPYFYNQPYSQMNPQYQYPGMGINEDED
jgi:hypothetical protein